MSSWLNSSPAYARTAVLFTSGKQTDRQIMSRDRKWKMKGQTLEVWTCAKDIYSCRGLGSQWLLMGPPYCWEKKSMSLLCTWQIVFLSQQKPCRRWVLLHVVGVKQTPNCCDLVKSRHNQSKPNKKLLPRLELKEDPIYMWIFKQIE